MKIEKENPIGNEGDWGAEDSDDGGLQVLEIGVSTEKIQELDGAYAKLRALVKTSRLGILAFDKAFDVITTETGNLQKKDDALSTSTDA